ncbi:glycosyltransferase [Novosphingobium flavum]|uniref:Glycosyltransferase n=1 Tax=Novosphingobium flavum TaxID=1778672 RepID=A0A7X1KM87_9SPHN|nr:glycosyltransferase [Novosphingobium flavum]MBC2666045.1 glycosyltransferase [Novosphingobium flavum]
MAASPAITVALSVFNNARHLDAAIGSVRTQTFTDFEFLIVDDGSTDGSDAIIAAHAASDPRIRPILRENRGLVASLNQLIAEARAPLFARMDGDDICRPERFARQVAHLAAHSGCGIVGTWAELIDEHDRPLGKGGEKPLTHAELAALLRTGPLFCHPSVMARTELLRATGGYHSSYRHCEDHDLWLRLAGRTTMANLPERLIRYRVYPGQVSQRHAVEQALNVAVSWEAHVRRQRGEPDPIAPGTQIPSLPELDGLFNEPGLGERLRGELVERLAWQPAALAGEGQGLLIDHIRALPAAQRAPLWRLAGRLARHGHVGAATRVALSLAGI